MFKLIIGNKNTSSWSLRPWLVLKMLDEPFEERLIDLHADDAKTRILSANPAGKVPVLFDRNLRIWDSLAICEYLAECFPNAGLLPANSADRAVARSLVAEMHSGFKALREQMPMDFARRHPAPEPSAELQSDIERIVSIWEEQRHQFGAQGPFLFGAFTVVDAFYAPVVSRFHTYQTPLPAASQAYVEHMISLTPMREWREAAESEIG